MRNVRILGVSLIAVFAFSGVVASAAFAENLPVFVRCTTASKEGKKYTGRYTNKECTKEATTTETEEGKKNKYESTPLPTHEKVATTGKSKTTTIKATGVNGKAESIVCKKDKFAGDVENTGTDGSYMRSTVLTLEGCEANASKADICGNVKAGTIEYKPPISPALRWLEANEAAPALIAPTGPSFTCGSETVELAGSLIGAIGTTSKGINVVWKVSGGHQELTGFYEEGEETGYYWYSEPTEAEATVEGKEELTLKGISAGKAS
jgi:hypothetical protein